MMSFERYEGLSQRYSRMSPFLSMLVVFALLTAFMVFVPVANRSYAGGGGWLPLAAVGCSWSAIWAACYRLSAATRVSGKHRRL